MTRKKISGIYCIENLINGKKYIGYSRKLNNRWKHHKSKLKNNCHINQYLQNAWNKYGEENFEYQIIQRLDNDIDLLKRMEIYWVAYHNAFVNDGNGYNLSRGGDGNFGLCQESRNKISETLKELDLISGNKNPNFGKQLPDNVRKKISDSLKKYYKNNHSYNFGRSPSKETREKISKSLSGRKRGKRPKCIGEKVSISQRGTKKKNVKSSSKFIGVSYNKLNKKWASNITYDKKQIYLGSSDHEIEAALMYNEAALEFYGWKAKLNDISQEEIEELWNLQ